MVGVALIADGGWRQEKLMITNFRLAEGGKEIPQALSTDGRIVAHGIQFDTGSDRLRPESTSTLRQILGLLEADPKLAFVIEGHTDNQGGAAVNGPLSERRAQAVKAWLVGKGVAEGRLTAKGLGESRPLADNATAEGRANNRRVEFVRVK
jgi:outer membrane protein OmpA-like peptidoglycan-associated protein